MVAHQIVDGMVRWPVLRSILRKRYDRRFETNESANLFRGVFETFEEAARAAPPHLPVGYDNPGSAAMYRERMRRTYPHDYPVMFWLQKLLTEGCTRIFDLGGHIGIRYYAYRSFLSYSDAVRWVVCDVPAVVASGSRVAARNGAGPGLSFSTRFEDVDGTEILMALASLQYLPETLADRLKNVRSPPTHLLLNAIPLHPQYSYFTLQSIGTAFCQYRITALQEFLAPYAALGYTLVDQWDNADKGCMIPFHPDRSLDRYFGFYFRRAS